MTISKTELKKRAIVVIIAGTEDELGISEEAFEKYTDYLMENGVNFFAARDLPEEWEVDPYHASVGDTIAQNLFDLNTQIEEYEEEPPDRLDNPTMDAFMFTLKAWGNKKFRIGSTSQMGEEDGGLTFAFLDVLLTYNDHLGSVEGQWLPFGTIPVDELKDKV